MNSIQNQPVSPVAAPPGQVPVKARKLRWFLLALGCVAVVTAGVMVAWWVSHRQRAPVIVGEPVVLSHALTSSESRGWGDFVPHGTQVLNNVTFVCDGALRTAGLRARGHPGAVLGIPIHRKGKKIHVLQAAENSPGNLIGSVYGRLRFNFGNGQSRELYLRFGIHGRDWFQLESQLAETVEDPNTEEAWVVENKGRKVWVRLFRTAVENPFPNEEVTTLDAISPLGGGNLLLFAVSTDNSPVRLEPPEDWVPPEKLTLAFALQNGDGTPVAGGAVRWQAMLDRGVINFPPFPCDGSGRMSLDFPTHAIAQIRYTANDPQGLTLSGSVSRPEAGWSPTQQIAVVFGKK